MGRISGMKMWKIILFCVFVNNLSFGEGAGKTGRGKVKHNPQVAFISAASAQIPKMPSGGYVYPVPPVSKNEKNEAKLTTRPSSSSPVERVPSASAQQPTVQQSSSVTPSLTEDENKNEEGVSTVSMGETSTVSAPESEKLESPDASHTHSAQINAIDVACGKEKMTVRITFDSVFNGVVYAKGHYTDPKCQFVSAGSNEKMYQFELTTGECGVSFIDAGLKEGGQAYVEALLVVIVESGVQEAWDAARKIRCLWEGNLEQTVTFPLNVNMLDQKLLTFSGDTASVSLEVQSGEGPKSSAVQGLVKIGDMLTAVVTVTGDTEFDLLVRNCVATDGSNTNRIILTDDRGCAIKSKLMGGWMKEKTSGSVLSYAKMSAFKFPDVMDLFLECTVSLCKGVCEECPSEEFVELYVPTHEHSDEADKNETSLINMNETEGEFTLASKRISVKAKSKVRRNAEDFKITESGSLKLTKVVHVVGPDDLPDFSTSASDERPIYGTPNGFQSDCFSLIGLLGAVTLTALIVLVSVAIFSLLYRTQRKFMDKC